MSSNVLLWTLLAANAAAPLALYAVNRFSLGRLAALRAEAAAQREEAALAMRRIDEALKSQGGMLFTATAPDAPPCVFVPWRCQGCAQANVVVSKAGDIRAGDRIAVACSGCGRDAAVVLVTSRRVEFLEGVPA